MAEQEQQKPSTPVQADTSPAPAEAKAPGWRGSPRRVPFWSGLRWLARACGLVVRRPLSWLGALLLVEALTVAGSLLLPRLADAGWLASKLTGYGTLVAWPGLWVLLAGGVARMVAAQGRGEPGHAFMVFAAFREKRLWLLALVVALYALALLVIADVSHHHLRGKPLNFREDGIILANTGFFCLNAIVGFSLLDWLPAWSLDRQLLVSLVVLGPLAVAPALLATLLGPALTMPAGQRPGQAAAALLLACRKNALPLMMAWCLAVALYVVLVETTWQGKRMLPSYLDAMAILWNALSFLSLIAGALAARDIFYQEQGAAPAKHAAWPAQEPRNPQDSSC